MALTSQRLPREATEAKRHPGKTNGLDKRGLRAKGSLKHPSMASSAVLAAGVILYGLSLMWPLASLTPPWLAYLLAFTGIGLILISLKNVWTGARILPRRT